MIFANDRRVATVMSYYGRLIPYVLRHRMGLLCILMLTAGTSVAAVLHPWPLKLLIDFALGDAELPESVRSGIQTLGLQTTASTLVVLVGAAALAVAVLALALDVTLTWVWSFVGQRMVYDLAADVFGRLQRLSLRFHGHRTVGDSLSRLTGDTYCLYGVTSELLVAPAQHLLTLVLIGVVAWSRDPGLTLLALAVAPVMAVSARFFGPRMKRRTKRSREAQSRLMSFVHQTLTAMPAVQAFGTESRNRHRYQDLADQSVATTMHGKVTSGSYGMVNALITASGTAVVMFVAGQRVLAGKLTVGDLMLFLPYLRMMQGSIKGLLGIYGKLKSVEAKIDRVMEVLDADDEVPEAPDAKALPARPLGQGAHVVIEAVTFGYEPDRPVLQDVTIEARPGQTIALVGPTGAGKTTVASLIPRFFDPWQGRVLFDGHDVRQLRLANLRQQIALVLQDPFLLPLSVAQNIAYGRPDAAEQEIINAAQAANADEFIEQLPDGYDTVIAERGATLSGGQKQRLAIARALLVDAPVLILDEPTSALDAQTESLLLQALERLMVGRTTFIIAHRLSTIRPADQIVVLDAGRVIENGTHQQLMDAKGHYHQMHRLQLSRTPMELKV